MNKSKSKLDEKNLPIPIDVEPLEVVRDRVARHRDYQKIAPTKINMQIEQTPVSGILGVSIGVARALLRAGLYHYARAYEILAEQGYLGRVVPRTEFFNVLSKYMKKSAIRDAFNEFSGRPKRSGQKKVYKTRVEQGRTAFLEFVCIISHSYIYRDTSTLDSPELIDKVKMHTNSFSAENSVKPTNRDVEYRAAGGDPRPKLSKRGRAEGRPSTAKIYIPSTGEIEDMLLKSGLRNSADKDELAIYPKKPFEVLANQIDYKAFIMSYEVFKKGLNDYARRELAEPVGISLRTVKEYAERMDISVTPNPPTRELIKRENIKYLPVDEDDYNLRVARKEIPEGCHITDIENNKYDYTQPQAWLALQNSDEIYKTCYVMSTYDPTLSRFNEYRDTSVPASELVDTAAKRRKERQQYRQEQKQMEDEFIQMMQEAYAEIEAEKQKGIEL